MFYSTIKFKTVLFKSIKLTKIEKWLPILESLVNNNSNNKNFLNTDNLLFHISAKILLNLKTTSEVLLLNKLNKRQINSS